MYGAILGDIIGSRFEFKNHHKKKFKLIDDNSRFTDDTVLTVAMAKTMLDFRDNKEFYKLSNENLKYFANKYPDRSYGYGFKKWASSDELKPYGSRGNGSAMRVSPIGYSFSNIGDVLFFARLQSMTTHNSKEAVEGACAIAASVFLGIEQAEKKDIKKYIEDNFSYDLNKSPRYLKHKLDDSYYAKDTVCAALVSFFESKNFEDAIRNAVSIGGDTDTIASMAGAIAEAHYGIDDNYKNMVLDKLDDDMKKIMLDFYNAFKTDKLIAFGGIL